MRIFLCTVVLSLCGSLTSAGFRSPWAQDNDIPASQSSKREESRNVCDSDLHEHFRRESPAYDLWLRQTGGDGGDGGVGVGLGSANVRAGVGNINITVGNVSVAAGDINVEDITIGNITVLVNVNLAGLADLLPSNVSLPSLPPISLPPITATGPSATESGLSTVTPTPVPSANNFDSDDRIRMKARQVGGLPPTTVSTGDLGVGASIGNISLTVGNINVTLGSVTLKNITIGNIVVLVNLGTQDSLTNLTALLGA